MQSIQALSTIISIRLTTLPDDDLERIAKDKSSYFSNPDTIINTHNTLKHLTSEIPLLSPVALTWSLVLYRLFAAFTGEGEMLPHSYNQAMVRHAGSEADVDDVI